MRVTKNMKYSLNGIVYSLCLSMSNFIICAYLLGLVGHLRTSSPDLFKFYSCLKGRIPQVPLSAEEKSITSGKIELTSKKLAELVKAHGVHQALLKNTFAWQQHQQKFKIQVMHIREVSLYITNTRS